MRAIIMTLIFLVCSAAMAKKYAFILGGGGETDQPRLSYDESIPKLFQKLKAAEYETTLFFNGSHAESTERLKEAGAEAIYPFHKKPVDEALTKFIKLIKEEKINSEDQIVIAVLSHGIPKEKDKTHKVELDEVDPKKGENVAYSLDKLLEISSLAEKNNIQLLVIDGSSFSGATQTLANKKTCVITTASEDTPMLVAPRFEETAIKRPFFDELVDGLKHHVDLPKAFLDAREGATLSDFPTMSTYKKFQKNFFDQFSNLAKDKSNEIFLNSQDRRKRTGNMNLDLFEERVAKLKSIALDTKSKRLVNQLIFGVEKFKKSRESLEFGKKSYTQLVADVETMKINTVKILEVPTSEFELATLDKDLIEKFLAEECFPKGYKDVVSFRYTPNYSNCQFSEAIKTYFGVDKAYPKNVETVQALRAISFTLGSLLIDLQNLERRAYTTLAEQMPIDKNDPCALFRF